MPIRFTNLRQPTRLDEFNETQRRQLEVCASLYFCGDKPLEYRFGPDDGRERFCLFELWDVEQDGSLTVGGREGEIRRRIVEADLVDGIVALPERLFYSTQIPVCLWLLARDKSDGRDRRGEVLMIDARNMGALVDRTHRALRPEELAELAGIYHAWRGAPVSEGMSPRTYRDIPGRCRAVDMPTLAANDFILAPTRHVQPPEAANGAPAFHEQFVALRRELLGQIDRAAALDREIAEALGRVEVP
jgi:type I restriction enzyme M protein